MEFSRDAFGTGQTWRDTMQVCLDGHVMTSQVRKRPELLRARCAQDGEKTITECPSCNQPIPGSTHYPRHYTNESHSPPEYCEWKNCGKPYPWTIKRATAARAKAEQAAAAKAAAAKAAAETAKTVAGDILRRLFDRFDDVAKQLRQRYDGRTTLDIQDEYDVQDLLHALLRLYFDDVRSEEWTPSYAGKSSRMDFLLKAEQCVVETKMARKGLTNKEIGDELIVDIERYKAHPDCKELWCFVYDPNGYIRNPRGIEGDLSGERDKLYVKVVIRS